MKDEPSAYVKHMRDAVQAVLSYASQHTFEAFEANEWDQAAAIRNLEIIGEAAAHISKELREKHPQIPWQDIIDFRNVAIHDYMEVDIHIVWDIIQHDVPLLMKQLDALLNDLE